METHNDKIGLYVRPWNIKYYTELAKDCFPNKEVITISEFKNVAEIWTGIGLYKSEKKEILDFEVLKDIHFRCRFLRSLPISESFALIEKTYAFLNDLFDQYQFYVFIGALVDNYTLDIISRICEERKILFVSLVGHFINGYSRFSIKGELNKNNREVSDDEVKRVLELMIDDEYKPNFDFNKKKSYRECIRYYYREKVKEIIFNIKKKLEGDPLNYHYNTLIFKGVKKKNIISKRILNEFEFVSNIKLEDNAVYFPLHYTPEATVDYWSKDYECALYEKSILEIIKHSSTDILFLIKEHPAMFLKRNLDFYKQIKQFDNVILIHPYESSNKLLKLVENVYVYTGSAGFEALIRGKRIFTKTDNYYSNLSNNIIKRDSLEVSDLRLPVSNVEKKDVIRLLLEGLIPARFINNRKIFSSDNEILKEYIKKYVDDYYKKSGRI